MPTLPASTAVIKGAKRRAQHVSGGDVQGEGDEAGHGVGHVQDQGAPPEGRCGGHQTEHEAGDHLPPARLLASKMLGDDEAEAHPAEDHHQRARRDGPDDHPRLLHQVVGVGEVSGGAGDDVAHPPDSLRQLSASSPLARSTTPQRVPWVPLDHPAGEGLRPARRVEGGQNLVPDAARLMEGDDGVEVAPQPVLGRGQHDQQVGPVAVELRVLVQVGVLPGVRPPVAPLLLAALHPVHGAYPVARVGVPDGVEEVRDLPVEDGAGDELAAALALHEVPVGVDEGQLVAGRGLGLGDVACGDCQKRRQQQRG